MNWQRWNTTTHIFELSTDDGGSWAPQALNASVLNEGLVATARLGGSTASIAKYLRGDQNWRVPVSTELSDGTDIAHLASANVFTANQLISKTRAELQLLSSGTAKARLYSPSGGQSQVTSNIVDNGATYNLDDITLPGSIFSLSGGGLDVYTASAGANPRTITQILNLSSAGILSLLGGQILFPATQVPSSNANTLDDYEEGSWTPVIGGTTSTSGQAYGAQYGNYVKFGRLVIAEYNVLLSNKGTITGAVQIQGLPFTIENNASYAPPNTVTYWSTLAVGWAFIGGYGVLNGTAANLIGVKAAAINMTALGTADIDNATQFVGRIIYRATA